MRRSLLISLVIALLIVAWAGLDAQGPDQIESWRREAPQRDWRWPTRLADIEATRQAARLAAAGTSTPESTRSLLQHNRVAEALDGLGDLASQPPDRIAATLDAIVANVFRLREGEAYGFIDRMREVLDGVRARLSDLPREDAARVAQPLYGLVAAFDATARGAWRTAMITVARTYAGTKTARLLEIDLIDFGSDINAEISALEQVWRENPGTDVGAKALWLAGFQLHVNVAITGVEPSGSDPTPRFLRVLEIVRELESGRYPPGEWTEKAPELVTGFFVSDLSPPTFQPGNLDRMIDGYESFVRSHVDWFGPTTSGDGLNYLLLENLGKLYGRRGDVVAQTERFLTALEAEVADPSYIRMFRARLYLRAAGSSEDRGADLVRRAEALVQSVGDDGDAVTARRARATLAMMAFDRRDWPVARQRLEDYLEASPGTSWAPLARLRLARCFEQLGDHAAAERAFARVAREEAAVPAMVVLASAGEARALEALGRFDAALDAHRRTLKAWDPAIGPTSGLDDVQIDRSAIEKQVASLSASLAEPDGAVLARGRRELQQRQFSAARATFNDYVRRHPAAWSGVADARRLAHLAWLEEVLASAGPGISAPDEAGALEQLTALGDEPFDFPVAAAHVARSALLLRQGRESEAAAALEGILERLSRGAGRALDESAGPGDADAGDHADAAAIDADVAAIRGLVFRPTGDAGLFRRTHWNGFTFPAEPPPYAIVDADMEVKLADGRRIVSRVRPTFPGLDRVLFLDADEVALLARILFQIGGTGRREPRTVMETPNQPVGQSVNILAFWNRYFPARPAHWGGWVLRTYPIVSRVEFLDAARTKAIAPITVGYAGATVVLEKVDGQWRALRLTRFWVT